MTLWAWKRTTSPGVTAVAAPGRNPVIDAKLLKCLFSWIQFVPFSVEREHGPAQELRALSSLTAQQAICHHALIRQLVDENRERHPKRHGQGHIDKSLFFTNSSLLTTNLMLQFISNQYIERIVEKVLPQQTPHCLRLVSESDKCLLSLIWTCQNSHSTSVIHQGKRILERGCSENTHIHTWTFKYAPFVSVSFHDNRGENSAELWPEPVSGRGPDHQ